MWPLRGGPIGLRWAVENADHVGALAIFNTGLFSGHVSKGFLAWRDFAERNPDLPVGFVIQGATATELSDDVVAAYDAPFPSAAYKAAARVYPTLVPITPSDPASEANRAAWRVFEQWQKPFVCCYSDGDPITRGLDRRFLAQVPGTRDQPHTTLHGGHFMQEDDPRTLAALIVSVGAFRTQPPHRWRSSPTAE